MFLNYCKFSLLYWAGGETWYHVPLAWETLNAHKTSGSNPDRSIFPKLLIIT